MTDPQRPQKSPYVLEVEPGTYAWCSCGKSGKQPFCDGAHAGSEFRPVIEKIEETTTIAWCGCKATGKAPRCDGSHSQL